MLGKANIGGYTSASSNAFIAVNASSLSGPNFLRWFFRRFIFNEANILAKFGTKSGTMLHRPNKDFSSVTLLGS